MKLCMLFLHSEKILIFQVPWLEHNPTNECNTVMKGIKKTSVKTF